MDRRKFLIGVPLAILAARHAPRVLAEGRKKSAMLMNRIGPSSSVLYVANADGSEERPLLEDPAPAPWGLDYHASWSADGKTLVFTSERNGLGQADIYLAQADGSGVRRLTDSPAVDDAAALSPDGAKVAFVSTRDTHRANIWILEIQTGRFRNLTGQPQVQGDPEKPDGFFRPSWSPDGQWLAFSSDRNTEWRGHDKPFGWEHTQELSIYVMRANGTGFRRIASRPDYCLGTPRWSPDGKRVVFYEITVEHTWGARRPEGVASAESQIVSVDVATGDRTEHTSGPGLKVLPQFLTATDIAYHRKGGPDEGLMYTSGKPQVEAVLRSPSWSPDGTKVIYEQTSFKPRPQNLALYSWDPKHDYRYTDVFPALSRDGKLVITEKSINSSIAIVNPDGSDRKRIFNSDDAGLDPSMVAHGLAGAFAPAWSPDGEWVAFGLGQWFQARRTGTARIMRVRRDGTGLEALTDGKVHSGFPSYSADGKRIVYRVWGADDKGLRILNLGDRSTKVLTTEADNLPGWSPDGSRIVFTRRVDVVNFDVFTVRPDGSDLKRLTTSPANDGHAVWSADGKHILWTSGMYGFRDEAVLYDNTFQQYGQIFIMGADGSNKRMLTDSLWEDSMPLYVPG